MLKTINKFPPPFNKMMKIKGFKTSLSSSRDGDGEKTSPSSSRDGDGKRIKKTSPSSKRDGDGSRIKKHLHPLRETVMGMTVMGNLIPYWLTALKYTLNTF